MHKWYRGINLKHLFAILIYIRGKQREESKDLDHVHPYLIIALRNIYMIDRENAS